MRLTRPKKGDMVGIVTPATGLDRGDKRFSILEERLTNLGLKYKYGKNIGQKIEYLGGSDQARASDLMDMFLDKDVKIILAMLGGYGCSRLVDLLDYNLIKENPKLIIGFSDITVLLNAINKLTDIPTIHGPVGIYIVKDGFDEVSLTDFSNILFENQLGRILKNPKNDAITLVEGVARGKLVGGNLTLINNLMGTPYEIDFTDKIVFIEEIDEKPRSIDRYFSTLRLAKKLSSARGFVFGYFTNCDSEERKSWNYDDIIKQYFTDLGVPVIYKFASGHDLPFISLPIGLEVELDATNKTIKVLEEMYEDN